MIYKKPDGSYLLDKGFGPATYHATEEGTPDEWAEAEAYAQEHPDEVQDWVEPEPPAPDRKLEITARLAEIDREAIRPMRAALAGTSTLYDTDKLAELEAEADKLREELRGLIDG
jgi:hypothetical protein